MAERLFRTNQSGINQSTDDDTAVGEHRHALIGLLT